MTNERFNLIAIWVLIVCAVTSVVFTVLSDSSSRRVQKIEEQRTKILKEALETGRPVVWIVNERCLVEAAKDAENGSL